MSCRVKPCWSMHPLVLRAEIPVRFARETQPAWVAGFYDDEMVRINGEWKMTHTALTQQILCNYEEGWGKTRVSLDEDWLKPVDDLKQNL